MQTRSRAQKQSCMLGRHAAFLQYAARSLPPLSSRGCSGHLFLATQTMFVFLLSYIENKTSGKRHPLVRNSINGLWHLNAYHLPKEMITKLEAGVFSGQASEHSDATR